MDFCFFAVLKFWSAVQCCLNCISRYVTSWIDTRQAQSERANLTILFDKYVPYCLEQVRCNLKTITPIPETSMVQVRTHNMLIMCLPTAYRPKGFKHCITYSTFTSNFGVVWCCSSCILSKKTLHLCVVPRHCVPCWTAC